AEAEKAYHEIMAGAKRGVPQAKIDGVFIEAMTKKRYELLIGCKKDEVFGPAIVFGMGGVAVEVFRDTAVGLPPLNMSLALKMIQETKIYKLLEGYRGMPGVDIEAIQFLLYKFAYLVADFPEIKELDINPFAVDENGGVVLDAKVILDEKVLGVHHQPYAHLVISPYPKELEKKFILKNKKEVLIRPIRPEDEKLEQEMIDNFSAQTMRERFLGRIKKVDLEMLRGFTQIDYDREIALVGELTERGRQRFIGVVRLIADPYNESASLAIAIADPWQELGLGSNMVDYTLDIARARGLKKVWAEFFLANERMKKILSKQNFTLKEKGKIIRGELELEN
ncbi:MAG TPA: GNAT family N-acetyltransferase, partial [Candidatus Methylomirabilis sp.]|nr:GNAT family N-acetyltransferase [Candidatus Methylomirabilis sp.]